MKAHTVIETIRFGAGDEDWAQDQVDEFFEELRSRGLTVFQQEIAFKSGLRKGIEIYVRDSEIEEARKARRAIYARRNRGQDRHRNYKFA